MKKLLLILMLCSVVFGKVFFVSSSIGSDLNDGSEATPVKTLTKARSLLLKDPTESTTVILLNGKYYANSTFILSNTILPQGKIVTIKGENATITGAITLTKNMANICDENDFVSGINPAYVSKIIKWSFADIGLSGTTLWSLDSIKKGSVPQLYCAGELVQIAQWPNVGYDTIDSIIPTKPFTVYTSSESIRGDSVGKVGISHSLAVSLRRELSHIYLHGFWFWDYSDEIEKIYTIDTLNNFIQAATPYSLYGYRTGQRFKIQNVISQINRPGTWAVDPARGYIYLWPGSGQDTFELATNKNALFGIYYLSNFTFENITLENSNSNAFYAYYCTTLTVKNCTIRGFSGVGVTLGYTQNSRIVNNTIYNTGSSAIEIRSANNNSPLPTNNIIANNTIYACGLIVKSYTPGIFLSTATAGCRVAYNTIYNTPHSAIIFKGNNHDIENNYIYNVCTETQDAGAIYTGKDWTARGTIIKNNFIKDCGLNNYVNGIYLDDYGCGTIVSDNIFENIPYGVRCGEGSDNTVTNNAFINISQWLSFGKRNIAGFMSVLKSRLKVLTNSAWVKYYPILNTVLDEKPEIAKRNIIKNNIVYNSGPAYYLPDVETFGVVDTERVVNLNNVVVWKYGVQQHVDSTVFRSIELRKIPIVPIIKSTVISGETLYVVCAPSFHSKNMKSKIVNIASLTIKNGIVKGDTAIFVNDTSGIYRYNIWYDSIISQDSTFTTSDVINIVVPEKQKPQDDIKELLIRISAPGSINVEVNK